VDLAAVRRCRGDHNRLGHALMLCYLRFPGRALRAGERPPAALLGFVAGQVEVLPGAISDYLAGERTRQRQSVECQDHLGLRPFGKHTAAELIGTLLPQAI
jgi:TnpA family transposase